MDSTRPTPGTPTPGTPTPSAPTPGGPAPGVGSSPHDGDGSAPSPAQMLALVREQQARGRERLAIDPVVLFGAWGAAWLVGFGLFFLASGEDPILPLPYGLTMLVFLGCLAVAGAITAVHVARVTRGIRGESARAGMLHGWTWLAAFVGLGGINATASHLGASPHVMAILAACGSGLVVGVIYMASGAAWGEHAMFGLGAWFIAVSAGAGFAGMPGIYLVMSLAGGGGFLCVAAWKQLRYWRAG